jgi:hypothetical protein
MSEHQSPSSFIGAELAPSVAELMHLREARPVVPRRI